MAQFGQLEAEYQSALEKWETMAVEHRCNILIVCAQQVEIL
jgi:hypothetical protein